MKQKKVIQNRGGSPSVPTEGSASGQEWQPIDTAPSNILVMTKIDDGRGWRNEAPLLRSGNLWFVADRSMYVYYTPTHWRALTPSERNTQRELLTQAVKTAQARLNEFCGSEEYPGGTSPE